MNGFVDLKAPKTLYNCAHKRKHAGPSLTVLEETKSKRREEREQSKSFALEDPALIRRCLVGCWLPKMTEEENG